MRGRFVKQETAARLEEGCDHGVDGRVLVRCGNERLVFRPGHKTWGSITNPSIYVPARLAVEVPGWHGRCDYVLEGRLTPTRLSEALPRVRELMKLPGLEPKNIDPKRTFLVFV